MAGLSIGINFNDMPPLKTYTFVSALNDNIKIVIKAYSLEYAYEYLTITTKHPADFNLIDT